MKKLKNSDQSIKGKKRAFANKNVTFIHKTNCLNTGQHIYTTANQNTSLIISKERRKLSRKALVSTEKLNRVDQKFIERKKERETHPTQKEHSNAKRCELLHKYREILSICSNNSLFLSYLNGGHLDLITSDQVSLSLSPSLFLELRDDQGIN